MIVPLPPLIVADVLAWGAFALMWAAGAPFVVVAPLCGVAIFVTAGLVAVLTDEFA